MGVRLIRMEDGFIRSVGLGSDFNWPYSLVLDEKGIYYDPSRPSGLEDILNALPEHPERAELCSRASALRGFIVEKGITKYNTGVDARWRAISMPWRKSIFWRSPGKGGAHVDRLRRAASGGPSRLFAHFPLSGFLAIPFPPFFRRRSRNLPHAR